MAQTTDIQSDHRVRMANHYEAIVLSMALLRGDRLSDDQKGQIVNRALAATSPEEFRHPGTISAAAVGQLHQFLIQTVEAGKPRNDFSAEAARAAQAAGGADGQRGGAGFGYIDAIRAGSSSARFREMAASDSAKGTGTSGNSVTPDYARSFAGIGIVGGTLRTFAEVGLDRSTFDQFRKEGFSREQIVDSATDTEKLGWHGREDLSIAQYASPDVRKAAVATAQARTREERERCRKREQELEERNENRPDNDPQKHRNRRFFERRHQDHRRHDAEAGLGTESRQHDASLPSSKDKAGKAERQGQDSMMAKQAAKQTASVKTAAIAGFEIESDGPPSAKATSVKVAAVKPAAPPHS